MTSDATIEPQPPVAPSSSADPSGADAQKEATQPGMGEFLRCLLGYLRPHRWQCAIVLVSLLPTTAFFTLQPLLFKAIIDEAILPGDAGRLAVLVVALGGLVVLRLFGELAKEYFATKVGVAVINDLRQRLFDHFQRLSLDFYGRSQVGDLLFRYTTDMGTVENALVRELPAGISRALTLLVCVSVLFAVEWRLALASVVLILLLAISPRYIGPHADRASYRLQQDAAAVASLVQENLGAQPVIKAFGLYETVASRFRRQIDQLARSSVRFGLLSGLMSSTVGVGGTSISVLSIGVGGFLVIQGQLTLGTLFAFTELLWYVAESIQGSSSIIRPLQQAAGGNRRLRELLDEPPRVVDARDAQPLLPFQRDIRFDDVSFSYTGRDLNLRGVSFSIPRGASVAFVGPSGCGKSTVLSLMMRFYDPDGGRITFDGHDLRGVTQASLRHQMGMVFQDNFLFNTTIRDNIRLGRPGASDENVEAAARAAEIHTLIESMPDGYDTVVGERGGRLSGGQRQRIAIARAILRNPAILILDEATSALDAGTEAAINATLERVAAGRTVASVTHRLAAVARADRIFVLDRGQLVEQGTHEELLALGGVYAGLWHKQSGMTIEPDGDRAKLDPDRLRAIPILADLDRALLAEAAASFVTEGYVEGRTVIHQGDPGDKFYVIVRGTVEVVAAEPNGKEQRLAVLQDGDHVGELALLHDVPRTATVRTLAPTVFLTLQRGQFQELIRKDPRLQERLQQIHLGRAAATATAT